MIFHITSIDKVSKDKGFIPPCISLMCSGPCTILQSFNSSTEFTLSITLPLHTVIKCYNAYCHFNNSNKTKDDIDLIWWEAISSLVIKWEEISNEQCLNPWPAEFLKWNTPPSIFGAFKVGQLKVLSLVRLHRNGDKSFCLLVSAG